MERMLRVQNCTLYKFGEFSFSRFGFIVRTDTDEQNHRITDRITVDANESYTDATAVSVSNYMLAQKTRPPYLIANILKTP